jgi:hypothetical protein
MPRVAAPRGSFAPLPATACFSISAEVDPGIMPRVLELFAKRALVPSRWVSDLLESEGRELAIDVQLAGLAPETAALIARSLRQIPGVKRVLTAHKG